MHWHEGDSSVCLTYSNTVVKVEACLFGSSNLPETWNTTQEVEVNVPGTPKERGTPMKNRVVARILRWVRTFAITVSLGSVGAVHLQPNALCFFLPLSAR